ncbi:MAG TPA: HPr family phosphocarrier protein [Pirellulales bacterium]|jgi:phosphotransferase system HPr (HPr) family protein|nr:HPr family phosphocarrier protein [Pirellulales bacterium]
MNGTVARNVTVTNTEGLHVRPCDLIQKLARKFTAQIEIVCGSERVDAKSILSLLSIAASAPRGTGLTIEASGADAEAALEALAELFARNFDE